jgi:hypothetical protein
MNSLKTWMKRALLLALLALMPRVAHAQTGSPVVIKDYTTGLGASVNASHQLLVSASAAGLADVTGTGTFNVNNATAAVGGAGYNSFAFTLAAGTFVGTIQPQCSDDAGTTYEQTQFYNPNTQAFTTSLVFASSNTYTALSIVCGPGFSMAQAKVTAFTSGTATATVRASTIAPLIATVQGTVAATQSGTWTVTQSGGPWTMNLTQVGGTSIALGQTTMSASLPVAIASNQSTLNTNPAGFSSGGVTGQATVTTSATALGSNAVHTACVTADYNNVGTGAIGVGFSSGVTTSTAYPLYTGQTQCWAVTNTNLLFLITGAGLTTAVADFTGI